MRRLFSLLGLLGVAACDSGVQIHSTDYEAYSPSFFVYAAADRDFLIAVRGNPFAVADDALAQSVVDAMQGNNPGPRTRFVTKPTETTRPGYRAVIAFNPAPTLRPRDVCAGREDERPATDASSPSAVELLAVFCGPDRAFSSLQAKAPVQSPTDEAFRRLMAQVTLGLFPDTDPTIDRGEDR